jgi:DNA-binding IclR family transcriptional regulator
MESYHPTLWRTCRTLANAKRLRCLKAVLTEPGLAVSEVAERAGIAENHACECLRALQARGLIAPRRQSRWVRYVPEPDPLVPSARPLLTALRAALVNSGDKETDVIRVLTGFTHPRRLVILRQLKANRSLSLEALVRATDISPQALYRHLAKLAGRNLIRHENDGWRLVLGSGTLASALLKLASR